MKISVIIPVFNEEKVISNCLTHIFDQTIPPDEVIVVDNNCSDRTIELAKKFPIRLISEKKQGITPARDKGFNAAKYEILGRIDADTVVPKNWVEEVKKRFENDPELVAFSGSTTFKDKRFNALIKYPEKAYFSSYRMMTGHDCLYGPNMAILKRIWEQVKEFTCKDDHLVHEDVDLAIHIAELNAGKIVFDPNFLVEASDRRWRKINTYVEYPYRYLKMIIKHQKSLQSLNKNRLVIKDIFPKTHKLIKKSLKNGKLRKNSKKVK